MRQFPKHLLHIYQRDPRTNLEGNTICSPIVRRTTVVICANAQTSRELHAEGILKVEKTGYHNPPKFWRHNCRGPQSSQRRERIAIKPSICDGSTRFGYSMDAELTVQKQDCTRYAGKFAAIPTSSKPGVIYFDNSLEFTKACEDLSWNHDKSTPHRSETHGIAQQAVRRVKEGTSTLSVQSGPNEQWW